MELKITGKQLCEIIKESKKSGVISFKAGELEIHFGMSKVEKITPLQERLDSHVEYQQELEDFEKSGHDQVRDDQLQFDELESDLQMVIDPAGWQEQALKSYQTIETEEGTI